MNGGGGHAPPPNGGEFLLQLLRKQSNSDHSTPSQPQTSSHDPAVAAVGPSISTFLPPHAIFQSNSHDVPFHLWNHSSPPPFAPHNYFQQQNPTVNPNLNPEFSSPPQGFNYASHQVNHQSMRTFLDDGARKFGFFAENSNSKPSLVHHQDQMQKHISESLNRDVTQNNGGHISRDSAGRRIKPGDSYRGDQLGMDQHVNSARVDPKVRGSNNNRGKQVQNGNYGTIAPPPGFASEMNGEGIRGPEQRRRTNDHDADNSRSRSYSLEKNDRILNQNGSSGQLDRTSPQSVATLDIDVSKLEINGYDYDNGQESRNRGNDKINGDEGKRDLDDLENHLVAALGLEDESGEKNDKKKYHRDKDCRSDMRGQWIMGQRMRNQRSYTSCPNGINRLNAQFLALFESLIPDDEEKLKQKHLLMSLEKLVSTEWPNARLYLYGSCANSFGFPKSDIDVCLVLELGDIEKADILLRLADMLISDNLENVQALTRARVPIIKLMDPATQISCDICINNVLAVVNTKLLRDYSQIDVRLRQLAFIVKHWAKSRGVNETYHGTLSSYAYVLMCIHFLQQRRPAILPCLQGMSTTYSATVNGIECAYFDQVEKLRNFGARNGESIAQLVWGFFHYWAYCHDYANDVISIRQGRTISKRDKDWTRRVGNDRHLICIEDPFEVTHDLGRVVDKFSIRVLREEFERAAHIMQHDPNPCVTLFQRYIPE